VKRKRAKAEKQVVEKPAKESEDFLRLQADYANYQRRTQKQLEQMLFEGKKSVLLNTLPVIDDYQKLVGHAEKSKNHTIETLAEGMKLVQQSFECLMSAHTIKPIKALGEPFDPELHEAMTQKETDDEPNTVVEVYETGYTIGERVLRPARVVVSKRKDEECGQ
jgi:molecular chaperone GrpE